MSICLELFPVHFIIGFRVLAFRSNLQVTIHWATDLDPEPDWL